MIYFVQIGAAGPIKIGTTNNLKMRLRVLQTRHTERLVIIAKIPGGFFVEKKIHSRLSQHRIGGEWFRPHADVIGIANSPFVRALKEPRKSKNAKMLQAYMRKHHLTARQFAKLVACHESTISRLLGGSTPSKSPTLNTARAIERATNGTVRTT